MTGRSAFSDEEWRAVGGAPLHAAAYVVASSPHHAPTTIRNMIAGARAATSGTTTTNQLIRDAREDATGDNGDPGPTKSTPENLHRLRTLLQTAAALLREKGGEDAAGYAAEIHRIATIAAAASKEGLLGLTGESINAAEASALEEIATIFALDVRLAPGNSSAASELN